MSSRDVPSVTPFKPLKGSAALQSAHVLTMYMVKILANFQCAGMEKGELCPESSKKETADGAFLLDVLGGKCMSSSKVRVQNTLSKGTDVKLSLPSIVVHLLIRGHRLLL